jgi:hypothetical protein
MGHYFAASGFPGVAPDALAWEVLRYVEQHGVSCLEIKRQAVTDSNDASLLLLDSARPARTPSLNTTPRGARLRMECQGELRAALPARAEFGCSWRGERAGVVVPGGVAPGKEDRLTPV